MGWLIFLGVLVIWFGCMVFSLRSHSWNGDQDLRGEAVFLALLFGPIAAAFWCVVRLYRLGSSDTGFMSRLMNPRSFKRRRLIERRSELREAQAEYKRMLRGSVSREEVEILNDAVSAFSDEIDQIGTEIANLGRDRY